MEMSIEEKAKAYDIALNKIKMLLGTGSSCSREELEYVFPELKETSGEMIREAILELVRQSSEILEKKNQEQMIAWLKKQGKPTDISADAVLDSNKDGLIADTIRCKREKQPKQNWSEKDEKYLNLAIENFQTLGNSFLTSWLKDLKYRVQPKVELSEEDERLREYCINAINGIPYYSPENKQELVGWLKSIDLLLIQVQNWSEEDERIFSNINLYIRKAGDYPHFDKENIKEAINWLKFLKGRVLPQPKQEWSDEDKKLIDDTCHLINTLASGYGEKVTEPITFSGTQMIASIKDRLRALVDNRPRLQWKPSDKQMENLSRAFNGATYNNSLLMELYQDLKKLKE